MYNDLIRWWLTYILLFFPFTKAIKKYILDENSILSHVVQFMDEITISVLFLFAIRDLFRTRELLNRSYLIIAVPLITYYLFGLISGIVNGNPFIVTIIGTFDYIKYFLVIYIYAAYFREFSDINRIFRPLLLLAVFLAGFGIIEEIWAIVFRYILGKDIMEPIMYLLRSPPDFGMAPGIWRFGMLRVHSFIGDISILGLLCLLVLTVYIYKQNKLNYFVLFFLLSGILLTFSRVAYAGLFFVIIIKRLRSRKTITAFVIVTIILFTLLSLSPLSYDAAQSLGNFFNYREYARHAGMMIWKEHPYFGTGPGTFGGIIAKHFDSPVYAEYNFSTGLLKRFGGGIDQFWPQALAETGIIGSGLFVLLILSVIRTLFIIKQGVISKDTKNLIAGLLVFMAVAYIRTLGTGFNSTAILFPYFAFIGICLGSMNKHNNDKC